MRIETVEYVVHAMEKQIIQNDKQKIEVKIPPILDISFIFNYNMHIIAWIFNFGGFKIWFYCLSFLFFFIFNVFLFVFASSNFLIPAHYPQLYFLRNLLHSWISSHAFSKCMRITKNEFFIEILRGTTEARFCRTKLLRYSFDRKLSILCVKNKIKFLGRF